MLSFYFHHLFSPCPFLLRRFHLSPIFSTILFILLNLFLLLFLLNSLSSPLSTKCILLLLLLQLFVTNDHTKVGRAIEFCDVFATYQLSLCTSLGLLLHEKPFSCSYPRIMKFPLSHVKRRGSQLFHRRFSGRQAYYKPTTLTGSISLLCATKLISQLVTGCYEIIYVVYKYLYLKSFTSLIYLELRNFILESFYFTL